MKRFLKFGAISGLGWLLDFTLLMVLVHAGVPAAIANFISASIAALSVFVISRHLVFERAKGAVARRLLGYFAYTLAMITLASLAIGPVIWLIGRTAEAAGLEPGRQILAALGKIAITPPLLIANFLTARHLSQKPSKASHGR